MRNLLLFSLATLVMFSAMLTPGQTKPDDFTAAEKRKIATFSRQFDRRLNRTKDITPLMAQFFVTDFVERNLKNKNFMFFDSGLVRSRSKRDLKRFYAVSINWLYLMMLASNEQARSIATTTDDDDGIDAYLATLPSPVRNEFNKHREVHDLLERFLSLVEADAPGAARTTNRYFRELQPVLERVAPMLRAYVIRNRTDKTTAWKKQKAEAGKFLNAYEAKKYPCDDDCYGFAKGTRITYVNIPLFQLILTKVGAEYKVLDFEFYVD